MYRPADYDDSEDDDFDEYGFSSYAGDFSKKPKTVYMKAPAEDYDNLLLNAVLDDDLDETKRILNLDQNLRAGNVMRNGWPILFHACFEAKLAIVEYLVQDLEVDVNRKYNLETALMIACSSQQPTEKVHPIVRVLLDHGAIIGEVDSYGYSPLMFACKEGHVDVVKEIVAESSLVTVDYEGNTALFIAVLNNHLETVKVLLRAGAPTNDVNRQGFTARQCAMNRNYFDIAELLPAEEKRYDLPAKYGCYSSHRNFIHGVDERDPPGYHPDIGLMLFAMTSENKMKNFAQADMDLFGFLTATDERLRELDVKYPIERKRILLGLYDFHQHEWSTSSLWTMPRQVPLDFFDILEALGNMLKHLTIMHASMVYTKQLTGSRDSTAFSRTVHNSHLNEDLMNLRCAVRKLEAEIKDLHRLTAPKPVLLVLPKEQDRRRCKVFKVGAFLLVGGLVVYFKIRR